MGRCRRLARFLLSVSQLFESAAPPLCVCVPVRSWDRSVPAALLPYAWEDPPIRCEMFLQRVLALQLVRCCCGPSPRMAVAQALQGGPLTIKLLLRCCTISSGSGQARDSGVGAFVSHKIHSHWRRFEKQQAEEDLSKLEEGQRQKKLAEENAKHLPTVCPSFLGV